MSLEKEINKFYDLANDCWNKKEYLEAVEHIEKAWELLPQPKEKHAESFNIADYLIALYLELKDFPNAKKWSDKIFKCDLKRIDSGERDFLAGRVEYDLGNIQEAVKHFKTANTKSDGRCFIDEDTKYKVLIGNENTIYNNFRELMEVADGLFESNKYSEALDKYFEALNFDEGITNSYIYLRKGQCHFELNELHKSLNNLLKAYMLDGIEIFDKEDEKYYGFLKKRMKL